MTQQHSCLPATRTAAAIGKSGVMKGKGDALPYPAVLHRTLSRTDEPAWGGFAQGLTWSGGLKKGAATVCSLGVPLFRRSEGLEWME